jgi:lysozyme
MASKPASAKPAVKGGKRGAAVTLASVVGIAVASALGAFIPKEESGRKVEVTVNADTSLNVRHVSGRQYLRVYLDMVGVATACDGITTLDGKPMPRVRNFTEAECTALLEAELVKHAQGVMACTPGLAISQNAHLERSRSGPRFAAVSLAYNVGVGAYCGSTAARRFNAGNFAGGCEAITWWNKAGGRVVRGLTIRRGKEANICREGLGALGSVL